MSALEDSFETLLQQESIPYERQVAGIIPKRRFVADFVITWHGKRILICEIQGGRFMRRSGHSSPKGLSRDSEKAILHLKEGLPTLPITDDRFPQAIDAIKAWRKAQAG